MSSFKHVFIGKEAGWTVHDAMVYQKKNPPLMRSNAYAICHELMIVFAKVKLKTLNPLKEPTKWNGLETAVSGKGPDAVNRMRPVHLKKEKTRTNILRYAVRFGGTTTDRTAFRHPAVFPERLAQDHILSWSDSGDFVLDPMC